MKAYKLISEDLSNLGSMGSSSRINYIKFFRELENAKKFALNEYKEDTDGKTFKFKNKKGYLLSGDLGFVMYTISELKFEDDLTKL